MRKIIYIIVGLIVLTSALFSCGSENATLSHSSAMETFKTLSPREGAEFYISHKDEYPFLDTLYRDSILPAVLQCNYFDLDSVLDILKETPYAAEIEPIHKERRKELIPFIKNEIDSFYLKQSDIFAKYYLPSLEMSLDSLIEEDVENIMDKYAGGIMNYRKLAFLFGRGRDDFKEIFWNKFDTIKYQNHIMEYVQNFLYSVKEEQSSYCKDLTGQSFNYDVDITTPDFQIGLSRSTLDWVKNYTSKQSDEIIGEAIKDYAVPMALGLVSGGVSTVYDIASTAYDINEVIEDVKNAKIDDDEMVKYICSHDLAYQIRNYYIAQWTSQVNNVIKKSNKELYNFIEQNL